MKKTNVFMFIVIVDENIASALWTGKNLRIASLVFFLLLLLCCPTISGFFVTLFRSPNKKIGRVTVYIFRIKLLVPVIRFIELD